MATKQDPKGWRLEIENGEVQMNDDYAFNKMC